LENANNLTISLDKKPLSSFDAIGTTAGKAKTDLKIYCTGDMRAKISLKVDPNKIESDLTGRSSVVKNERENMASGATGIGFVVSTDSERLENGNSIELANLGVGAASIPIYAEYYRYGNKILSGEVQASAAFVIEFN